MDAPPASSPPEFSPPTLGRHRHAGPGTTRHTLALLVKVLASACSVIIFVAFAYGWYNYNSLTRNTHSITVAGLGEPTSTNGAVQHNNGLAQNILIVGIDSRAGLTDSQKRYYRVGQGDQSLSTDTVIVVHVPANGRRATLLSIPRDTYVDIPGYQSAKLNAAYADGYALSGATTPETQQGAGASLLLATVKQLTGLSIDHYVQVGFSGFVEIVKAIGNVPVDLCESVNDTYAHNRAVGISGASGFKMSAGRHDLTPQQALEFVRQRHNIPGPVTDDLGREQRQRYFLRAAFAKIASADVLLNPFKLKHLIAAVDDAFTFGERNFGIQQFAEQMSDLTAGDIVGKSIPTTGEQDFGGTVGDALTVDTAAVKAFVHKFFYPAPRRATAAPRTHATTSSPAVSSSSASPRRTCVY